MVTHVAIRLIQVEGAKTTVLTDFTTPRDHGSTTIVHEDVTLRVDWTPALRELVKDADYIVDRDYGDENL